MHIENGKSTGQVTIELDGKALLLREGFLNDEESKEVVSLLMACWHRLAGSRDTAMKSNKLFRAEKLRVEDGRLRFDIARHGGTVNGSSREAIYTWELQPCGNSVAIVAETHRQIKAMAKGYTKADARKDAFAAVRVLTGRRKNRGEMEVIDANSVIIYACRFAKLGEFKQTRIGRRKQFIAALDAVLPGRGWVVSSSNPYESNEITLSKVGG